MVGSGYVVKLGDFGMARAMYDSDYYRFGRKGNSLVHKRGWPNFLTNLGFECRLVTFRASLLL